MSRPRAHGGKIWLVAVILFSLTIAAVQAANIDPTISFGYRIGPEWQNGFNSPLGSPYITATVRSSSNTPRDFGSPHTGIDFDAAAGTPAVSVGSGTVVIAGASGGAPGNWVWVDLGGGLHAVYMHLNSVSVSVGNTVQAGIEVGKVGNTGESFGAHLHFTFRTAYNNNINDNPWWYMRHYAAWNNAQDLDMFKNWYHDTGAGGRFNITVYTRDLDISSSGIAPASVTVFHKKAGETTWRSTPMTKGTGFQYYWDFGLDSNYQAGDQIQAIVRGEASNAPKPSFAFENDYRYAFAPGRYKKPDPSPNFWPAAPTQWFTLYR